ncbi:MAG TPA: SGNH/GDSL hydrolase family protein [Gemmatimonadaceae bacterium]|nr:SGNH/GDSL hydrolase family protein [Gemmatimonadaceae bacterium]
MPVILFQGDSITDVGRNRTVAGANNAGALGGGYPLIAASHMMRAHPDSGLQILNRGVSGDKVPQLQARWETDTIALKPDILSILVGVNDLWHKLNGNSNGTVADYESQYHELLKGTLLALPAVRLVILEPFVLMTGAVNEQWFPEFDERRAAAARVAKGLNATFIPLQSMFTQLAKTAPASYWLGDGVHPTIAGHAAIADRWREVVNL